MGNVYLTVFSLLALNVFLLGALNPYPQILLFAVAIAHFCYTLGKTLVR